MSAAIRLTGMTADDRYLLRVEVPLSTLWVRALASTTELLEARHPTLDGAELLARVIAAGCCAIQNEERTAQRRAAQATTSSTP